MQTANRFAFKEWAVTCAALAAGRQSLLVRKGGIHERGGSFEVEHDEFWLFPTRFHQSRDEIRDTAAALLESAAADAPPEGFVRLSLYAVVEDVLEIREPSALERLGRLQVLSERTLIDRFQYRQPSLFVLVARIFRAATPLEMVELPRWAGCRTWVDLERELPTAGMEPVLSDADHGRQRTAIRAVLP